ncbi:MAG: GH36-type glycosyl hydrolase domain-containing protein [Chthoniobacteraceae bacterium]
MNQAATASDKANQRSLHFPLHDGSPREGSTRLPLPSRSSRTGDSPAAGKDAALPLNLHGHFADEGRAFVQTDPRVPRPWISFLWNESFIASCSHVGQGYALLQDQRGFRLDLHEGRALWIIDVETGDAWSANGLPLPPAGEPFSCTHRLGSVCIERQHDGIGTCLEIGVSASSPCELWQITLMNRSGRRRQLRVVPFIDCVVGGVFPAATAGRFRPEYQAATVTDIVRTGNHLAHFTDGVVHGTFLRMDRKPSGFDTRRSAFVGPYGNVQAPAAIFENGSCTGSLCDYERPVLALETIVTLEPGQSDVIGVAAGLFSTEAELRQLSELDVARELESARSLADEQCGRWSVETPQAEINAFFNGFLQHQLRLNASWARVYYNGIRDLSQDNAALAIQDPPAAWSKFRQILAFQYASGYAPRAWIGGGVVEQDYADSPVWLAMTAHALIMETGDMSAMEEQIPYCDGPPASVYEHLRQSLRYLWEDRGIHGLSKIHRGDWNDLLNAAGTQGKGESVWLSQALCVALANFGELAAAAAHQEDASWAARSREALLDAIRCHGFDAQNGLFIRAFTDDGKVLHTAESEEGIDLIVQAWGVLSGAVTGREALRVMEAAEQRLECEQGTLTMERGFHRFRPEIGFVSATRPGCNVNAGFYQHAAAFAVVADCVAGRGSAAWRRLRKLLPFTSERGYIHGEPFVVNNAYYGPASGYRQGQSEMGWLTGTAGWLVRAMNQHIFGLRPTLEGLALEPCLPQEWEHAAVSRRFRGATYHIEYVQAGKGESASVEETLVDGKPWLKPVLPFRDGAEYQVKVRVRRSSSPL